MQVTQTQKFVLPKHVAIAENLSEGAELILDPNFNGVVIPPPPDFQKWTHPGILKASAVATKAWRCELKSDLLRLGNSNTPKILEPMLDELEEMFWALNLCTKAPEERCRFDIVAQEDVGKRPHVDNKVVVFKVLRGPGIVIYDDSQVIDFTDDSYATVTGEGIELPVGSTLIFCGPVPDQDTPDGYRKGLVHKGPHLEDHEVRLALRVFCEMPERFPFLDM